MSDAEQPGVPEDSDALPPQWRQPEPTELPAEHHAATEPQARVEAPVVERDFPAYPAHEAVREVVPQPVHTREPQAEPASSPVTVIEVGNAAEEPGADASNAEAGGQGQRRGWWRRLIE